MLLWLVIKVGVWAFPCICSISACILVSNLLNITTLSIVNRNIPIARAVGSTSGETLEFILFGFLLEQLMKNTSLKVEGPSIRSGF